MYTSKGSLDHRVKVSVSGSDGKCHCYTGKGWSRRCCSGEGGTGLGLGRGEAKGRHPEKAEWHEPRTRGWNKCGVCGLDVTARLEQRVLEREHEEMGLDCEGS